MVPRLSPAAAATLALVIPWTSAASSSSSSSSSVSARQSTGDDECRDVHIFLARGNNEPYPGRQGKLVTAICDGLDSCDYEDIQFRNPLEAPYCQSVEEGAANGVAQVTAYNERCPEARLVLSGYSQGGQVIGDILGGGGGRFFENCQQKSSAGLDATKAPGNKISAVLIFGDVRFTANQPYNYLSGSAGTGLFPRPEDQLVGMRAYSDVMRSYCVASDPICAGGDVVANHLNYFDIYTGDAGKWVQEAVFGESRPPTSSRSSTTMTNTMATSTSDAAASSSSASASSETLPASASTDPSTGAASTATPTTSDNSEEAAASSTPTGPSTVEGSAAGTLGRKSLFLGLTFVAGLIAVL